MYIYGPVYRTFAQMGCLYFNRRIYLYIYLSICPSFCLYLYIFIHLSIHLSILIYIDIYIFSPLTLRNQTKWTHQSQPPQK